MTVVDIVVDAGSSAEVLDRVNQLAAAGCHLAAFQSFTGLP